MGVRKMRKRDRSVASQEISSRWNWRDGTELPFQAGEEFAGCTFGQAKLRRNFRVSRDGW
jgi:hypothetical protein